MANPADFKAKASKTKAQCSRGYSCGLACIQRRKACSNALGGRPNAIARWLKGALRAITGGTKLLPKPLPKPSPKSLPRSGPLEGGSQPRGGQAGTGTKKLPAAHPVRGKFREIDARHQGEIERLESAGEAEKLKALKTRRLNEKKQALIDALSPGIEAAVPRKRHGMSELERMRSVEFEGQRFHFSGEFDKDSAVVKVLRDLSDREPLPGSFTEHTRNIYFSRQRNQEDDHWAKEFRDSSFESAATGGDGEVVFYNSSPDSGAPTLYHEMGHNFAQGRYRDFEPGENSDFARARQSEPPPTEYAASNIAEDFADSCELYFSDRPFLSASAPKRRQVIERLIHDETYAG